MNRILARLGWWLVHRFDVRSDDVPPSALDVLEPLDTPKFGNLGPSGAEAIASLEFDDMRNSRDFKTFDHRLADFIEANRKAKAVIDKHGITLNRLAQEASRR